MAKVTRNEIVTRIITVEYTDRESDVLVKMIGRMTERIEKELDLSDEDVRLITGIWKSLKENN